MTLVRPDISPVGYNYMGRAETIMEHIVSFCFCLEAQKSNRTSNRKSKFDFCLIADMKPLVQDNC